MDKHGKYFGAMANHVMNNESDYNSIVASQVSRRSRPLPLLASTNACQYNLITAATLYWGVSEPAQNQFDLSKTKAMVAYARQHGQFVRCHNLVWHQVLPDWVLAKQNASASEITAILKNHVETIVTQLKGQCDAYDVVNEMLNENGTLRDTMWKLAMGDGKIPAHGYQLTCLPRLSLPGVDVDTTCLYT